MWINLCWVKWADVKKALSHIWHWYFLVPLWKKLCLTKLAGHVKALLHTSQLYLTSLWTLLCWRKVSDVLKILWHRLHSTLLGLWSNLCFVKAFREGKTFLHLPHLYVFTSLCTILCCDTPLKVYTRVSYIHHTENV